MVPSLARRCSKMVPRSSGGRREMGENDGGTFRILCNREIIVDTFVVTSEN